MRSRFLAALTLTFAAPLLAGCEGAQDALVQRAAARATPRTDLLADDALRVLICGSASPLPHPTRARPCTAVFAAGKLWVVDVGPGSWNHMGGWRVPPELGAVLITHFHSDHIGELGEWNLQSWVNGRSAPLTVIGPEGVQRVVAGFNEAYALDVGYRAAHHGADFLPPEVGGMTPAPIAFPDGASSAVVHDADGLRITAFLVGHAPISPAVGYRFDYQGRSAVVSGDTVKSANLIRVAQDADVLVHEAQANHIVALLEETAADARPRVAKILGDIPSYHTSPVQAAEAANEAGVKLLVLSHLTPPPPNRLVERMFVRGVDAVRSDGWLLADDGMLFTLPAGSGEIERSEID
ncbi:MAG TPA: MBL fold metallo-hydrolase [Myxococcota bacterium]|nr:MBL fold metallo-hydrolase [Myxococcota bacterium]